MAEKENLTEIERRLSDKDFGRVLAEMRRIRGHAKDYAQQLGQHLKTSEERYGINKKALKDVEKLERADQSQRHDYLLSFFACGLKAGIFNDFGMFSDLLTLTRKLVAQVEGKEPEPEEPIEQTNAKRLKKGIKALDDLTAPATPAAH